MTLRIAISGAGYIANIHAAAIRSLKDVSLEAVVEAFPEKAQAFAQGQKIPHVYSSMEELIATQAADAVVIGVPNALHFPQALAALNAGMAVMVEKPMAMNAEEASTLLEASKKSGAALMVAHCWRFDEEVNWLRSQREKGKLGQIIRTKGYGVHANWGPSGWFTRKNLAGGGALADMGIHALDTARYLLGDPLPVSVYARIGTFYIDGDVDDTDVLLVNWDNGATSYIESGWWQPHMDGPEACTQLYGTKGFGMIFPTRLELPNPEAQRVDVLEPGFPFPRVEQCPQGMYDRQMTHFVESIQKGTTPIPGGLEGLINMKIVDAAYESSKSGQVVTIR